MCRQDAIFLVSSSGLSHPEDVLADLNGRYPQCLEIKRFPVIISEGRVKVVWKKESDDKQETVWTMRVHRVRKIEGIDTLVNLTEFHAAKNKLLKIEGLEKLTKLVLVACQCNFIQEISGLDTLVDLEELYL